METATVGVIAACAVPVLSGALYLIRQEINGRVEAVAGRVTAHEAGCTERQKKLDERHDSMDKTLIRLDAKLDRVIERL